MSTASETERQTVFLRKKKSYTRRRGVLYYAKTGRQFRVMDSQLKVLSRVRRSWHPANVDPTLSSEFTRRRKSFFRILRPVKRRSWYACLTKTLQPAIELPSKSPYRHIYGGQDVLDRGQDFSPLSPRSSFGTTRPPRTYSEVMFDELPSSSSTGRDLASRGYDRSIPKRADSMKDSASSVLMQSRRAKLQAAWHTREHGDESQLAKDEYYCDRGPEGPPDAEGWLPDHQVKVLEAAIRRTILRVMQTHGSQALDPGLGVPPWGGGPLWAQSLCEPWGPEEDPRTGSPPLQHCPCCLLGLPHGLARAPQVGLELVYSSSIYQPYEPPSHLKDRFVGMKPVEVQ